MLIPAIDPAVAFPHPLITEVLYAVPVAKEGDASGDGKQSASGDEFIELVNPHDKPIQLKGYTLTDRNPENKGQFKFVFPALELQPGQVVLVFNGYEATWSGPVGDAKKAPDAGNDKFHNAFVFTARIASSRTGLANEADFVLLTSPGNDPIQCVHWGEAEEKPPANTAVLDEAPKVIAESVQRDPQTGKFSGHPSPDSFSPGVYGEKK